MAEPDALLAYAEGIESSLALAGCTEIEATRLATIAVVARLLRDAAAATGPLRSTRAMIAEATRLGNLSDAGLRLAAGELAMRDSRTGAQPPRDSIRTLLRLASSVAALRRASLWLPGPDGRLQAIAQAGGAPTEGTAKAARRAFTEQSSSAASPGRTVIGVPVGRPPRVLGAVAGRTTRGLAGIAVRTLESAAPRIALALGREQLVDAAETSRAEAAKASERALVRFGFDMHDGPAQDVAGLLADLRGFKSQVAVAYAADPQLSVLTGRLEDLEARALAVADQIRRVARSARSPAVLDEPVEEVLRGELLALREVSGPIRCELEVSGPVDAATPSQRIALLRAIQEALRNVREHSDARTVSVRVDAGEERTVAEVRDDGCGFEAERALAAAARQGRMGLAGIVERARLLGGDCEVSSAPGGPTTIRISLPRWEPGGGR